MMNCDDELAFASGEDPCHIIARVQASIVENNNEIVMNFAPSGKKMTAVVASFSEATASTMPTEDMCVSSVSVSPLSDKDDDNTIPDYYWEQ